MSEDDRHERRQRRLQNISFVGAILILALVLGTALLIQYNRRERQPASATVLPKVTRMLASPSRRTAPAGPPYPLPGQSTPPPASAWQSPAAALDPARAQGDSPVLRALFLGLTQWPWGEKQARPALAQSWTVSEDGLTYTFYLRSDVYWVQCDESGREVRRTRPVRASDVVFGIARALRPETRAPRAEVLLPISGAQERLDGQIQFPLGVEAVDPLTVRFVLNYPAKDLPNRLADPVAWPLPPEPVEGQGDSWIEPGKIWVNGAFCPISWQPGESATLVANPWLPADLRGTLAATTEATATPRPTRPTASPYPSPQPD